MTSVASSDPELDAVAAEIRSLDSTGVRIAQVLRDTLDQLYDGQRTGRYRWEQLYKTEKTHCGTLVEINLQREFKFAAGTHLDFSVSGVDVDCKYSQRLGAWMIPPEAVGHLCLLLWAEDSQNPRWSLGIARVTADRLNAGGNRDSKSTLKEGGRGFIVWIFQNAPLPPNVLLQLDDASVRRIMSLRSGQSRINELFRVALGKVVRRAVIATVAQQDDYMKRVRSNGGARTHLQKEGIVILGQYLTHAAIAKKLGLPVPGRGDSVSVRLTPANGPGPGVAKIGVRFWKVAQAGDPAVRAPDLPEI